jgi:hypothetical protein
MRAPAAAAAHIALPPLVALGTGDTVLMVTPMFHANSWGISFSGE